jgi:hypothetical protein
MILKQGYQSNKNILLVYFTPISLMHFHTPIITGLTATSPYFYLIPLEFVDLDGLIDGRLNHAYSNKK